MFLNILNVKKASYIVLNVSILKHFTFIRFISNLFKCSHNTLGALLHTFI